jgi:hypothetical protein
VRYRSGRARTNRSIPLWGSQPADEQGAVAVGAGPWGEPVRVGAAVDHPRPRRWGAEHPDTVRKRSSSRCTRPPQVRPGWRWSVPPYPPPGAGRDHHYPCGYAPEMMGVDDLGPDQLWDEQRGHRLGGVAVQPDQRPQHPDLEPAALAPAAGSRAEADRPAIDLGGESSGQLQGLAFPAAVQPVGPEHARSHMDDSHAHSLPDHPR